MIYDSYLLVYVFATSGTRVRSTYIIYFNQCMVSVQSLISVLCVVFDTGFEHCRFPGFVGEGPVHVTR